MRLKSLFLACLLMLVSALPALAVDPAFNIGTVSGTPGTQVTVPVTLTNNGASIAAMGIDIGYDTAQLSVPMNAGGTAPLAATRGAAILVTDENGDPIKSINQSIPSPGVLRIGVLSTSNNLAIGDGVVVNVKFNILAGASGALTLANTPTASSPAGTPVTITGANGVINTPVVVKYSVTYDGNGSTGGTAPVDATSPYVTASTVTVLPVGTLTKTGSTFGGWNTAANGSGTSYAAGATFTINANTTLYAKWTALPTFAVTYNGNGNTGGTAPVDAASPYVSGSTVTVLPVGTLTKTDNTFTGWNTAANGSGTAYAPAATFTVNAVTTLYAQWSTKPAPILTVNTKANNSYTNDDTLNITGSATKNSAADAVKGVISGVTVNGAAVTVAEDGTFSTAVTLVAGANTITVVASDSDTPPVTTTNSRIINYDITAPTITFIAPTPANNSQVNTAAVIIKGTVPADIKTVTVALNGGAAQPATIAGTTFTYNATLIDGDNTLDVLATDLADNTGTQQLKVKLDTVKPVLAITDPAQDISTTYGTWLVKGTTSDNNAIASLSFKVDGVAITPAPAITDGAFQQQVTLSGGASNTRAISVTVTDAAGNTTTVQRNIIYKPLTIGDAVRALNISVGLVVKTPADSVLDVAPLEDGKPKGDTFVDAIDAGIILRKVAGLVNW